VVSAPLSGTESGRGWRNPWRCPRKAGSGPVLGRLRGSRGPQRPVGSRVCSDHCFL